MAEDEIRLSWLGQAGFLIESDDARIVIDPYLSDSLAEKYAGKKFPHVRMQPVPIQPAELRGLSMVLCTHGHSDHMDSGTLPVLSEANRDCIFVCPAAEREKALGRGVPSGRFAGIDDGEIMDAGIRVTAVASAHEDLAKDAQGRSLYLGYVIDFGGYRIYHSGDCIPYEGLTEKLRAIGVDAALLPVNGRDSFRTENGVLGNFTTAEAVKLCREAGIGLMIPHHFGMFDFNTVDPGRIEDVLSDSGLNYIIPVIGQSYIINNSSKAET
ncbi:MAG: MBL fold metallo-hydrolase [Spirochaetales bacterium]|nr:MBL fold metallo-hydrolase [Spirochaetales bacterium]